MRPIHPFRPLPARTYYRTSFLALYEPWSHPGRHYQYRNPTLTIGLSLFFIHTLLSANPCL